MLISMKSKYLNRFHIFQGEVHDDVSEEAVGCVMLKKNQGQSLFQVDALVFGKV